MAQDLAAPEFEVTLQGIQIESKDDIKRRLGRSPDRGDAVLLAWAGGSGAVKKIARMEADRARKEAGLGPARRVNRPHANVRR